MAKFPVPSERGPSGGERVDPVAQALCAGVVDLVAHQRGHLVVAPAVRQEPDEALVVDSRRDALCRVRIKPARVSAPSAIRCHETKIRLRASTRIHLLIMI